MTKRVVLSIGVFLLAIVLSGSLFLFAGSQGWAALPSLSVWARPIILGIGEQPGILSDPHDYWVMSVYLIEQRPPLAGYREVYKLSISIPKRAKREPIYPHIVQLW